MAPAHPVFRQEYALVPGNRKLIGIVREPRPRRERIKSIRVGRRLGASARAGVGERAVRSEPGGARDGWGDEVPGMLGSGVDRDAAEIRGVAGLTHVLHPHPREPLARQLKTRIRRCEANPQHTRDLRHRPAVDQIRVDFRLHLPAEPLDCPLHLSHGIYRLHDPQLESRLWQLPVGQMRHASS